YYPIPTVLHCREGFSFDVSVLVENNCMVNGGRYWQTLGSPLITKVLIGVGIKWKRPPFGKWKPPTKSMLIVSPSGTVGVLKSNETDFSKEVEGLSSSSSSSYEERFLFIHRTQLE
ncbi:hypothetical protein HAX54_003415, partial [Datura stramonium]|nr:hypothetical protein [Datura stramonium]